jgi:hypothetical protein
MPFVAEDGTGLADANSLGSVTDADVYFEDRRIAKWTSKTDALKEAALIAATDYIEMRFSAWFKGEVQYPEVPQALSFPRLDIEADDVVPVGILRATFEYALRALDGPLLPDPKTDASGMTVTGKVTKVGPIETRLNYSASGVVQTMRPYPAADMLIAPFLRTFPQGGAYR